MRTEKQRANLAAEAKRRREATHCVRGHKFDGGKSHKGRQRRCLECHNACARRSRRKMGRIHRAERRLGHDLVCALRALDQLKTGYITVIHSLHKAAKREGLL